MQVAGKSKHFSQFAASRTAPSVVSGRATSRLARNPNGTSGAELRQQPGGTPDTEGAASPAQGRSGTPPGEPPKTSRPAGSGVAPGSRMILSVLEPACDAFLRHGDGIPRKITKFARL